MVAPPAANSSFHNGVPGFAAGDPAMQKRLESWFQARRANFESTFRQAMAALQDRPCSQGRKLVTALAIAWAAARGQDPRRIRNVVFQHHNNRRITADAPAMLRDFPDTKLLATCRHPIESALSFKTLESRSGLGSFRNFSRNVRGWSVTCWRNIETVAGMLPREDNLRLVDLNAMHGDPDRMLARLSAWLGTADEPCLRRSTVCGFDWLGNSADGRPIPTFESRRAHLLYPGSIGREDGLSSAEYRFAEWFTRAIRVATGYPDPADAPRCGLAGFLWIAATRIEPFEGKVIAHDRGVRRLARRFGLVEQLLVLRELLALGRSRRRSLAHLRLDLAVEATKGEAA